MVDSRIVLVSTAIVACDFCQLPLKPPPGLPKPQQDHRHHHQNPLPISIIMTLYFWSEINIYFGFSCFDFGYKLKSWAKGRAIVGGPFATYSLFVPFLRVMFGDVVGGFLNHLWLVDFSTSTLFSYCWVFP